MIYILIQTPWFCWKSWIYTIWIEVSRKLCKKSRNKLKVVIQMTMNNATMYWKGFSLLAIRILSLVPMQTSTPTKVEHFIFLLLWPHFHMTSIWPIFTFNTKATIDQVCEAVNTKVKLNFEGVNAFWINQSLTLVYTHMGIYNFDSNWRWIRWLCWRRI